MFGYKRGWLGLRRVLFVAAVASLMANCALAVSSAAPAGAAPAGTMLHCTGAPGELQPAINAAAAGSTIKVDGTCTGSFFIAKDLTLAGPAVLDGDGTGPALNVISGTVVLNDLTLQHGVGIFNFGGGLWNGGQLTLNRSTVTDNKGTVAGGVFNYAQLTLNRSTVSNNEAVFNGGGIFNCAASFHEFGLCTGAPGNVTLNGSTVSGNTAGGWGSGIWNDAQANVTVNGSMVSGNIAGGTGGGIKNDGTATLNSSILSGNTAGSGGGIDNPGAATLNNSTVSDNHSNFGPEFWGGGGGILNTGPTTLNNSIVRDNSAVWLAGGIFAQGQMTINKSSVTGNSAGAAGGGLVAWDGPTTVANGVFSNNTDGGFGPDNPVGVWVAPVDFGGFFINHPSFTTTHSTFS